MEQEWTAYSSNYPALWSNNIKIARTSFFLLCVLICNFLSERQTFRQTFRRAVLFKRHFNIDVSCDLFKRSQKDQRQPNLKSADGCLWNLLFHLDCPFNNLLFCLPILPSPLKILLQSEAVVRWCSVKKMIQQLS